MTNPLSPSQIKVFLECERKWAAKYLEGYRDEGSDSTSFGKTVHEILAEYLKNGILPIGDSKEEVLALAMIKVLPLPDGTLRVEEPFQFVYDGVTYRGVKDLVYDDTDGRVVHDHKTTSKLAWALSQEALDADPQKVIYDASEFEADVDLLNVKSNWLYGPKDGEDPVNVFVLTDRPAAYKALDALNKTARRMLKLYEEQPGMNDLPATGVDLGSCHAYGKPCPFIDKCDITPVQRVKAKMLQERRKREMNFKDRVAARRKEQDTPPEPTTEQTETLREKVGFGVAVSPPAYAEVTGSGSTSVSAGAPVPFAPYTVIGPDTSTSEPEEEVKPKRGRPKGAKNKAKEADPELVDLNLDAYVLTPVDSTPTVTFTLCVNVYPPGNYKSFAQFVEPVLAAINAEYQVPDYRLLDYGKGPGIYANALDQYLKAGGFFGTLVVDATTQEGRDALPTLERHASAIYRRF